MSTTLRTPFLNGNLWRMVTLLKQEALEEKKDERS